MITPLAEPGYSGLTMMMLVVAPGIEINLLLLIFIGFAVGVLSGFVGVGGGYLMTPALIILGVPANVAVGTSLAWLVGNSVVGVLRHRQLGNIDMKMAVPMIVGTMVGVEIGVRLLSLVKGTGLVDVVVLATLIVILLAIGAYTFREVRGRKAQLDRIIENGGTLPAAVGLPSMARRLQGWHIPPMIHFPRSRITISLWVVLAIGTLTGLLAGFVGVGGGFVRLPALIYLVGLPPFMAVGTDIFGIIFSASFGCIRHTMNGNVIILIAVVMMFSSSIGTQFGALITQYVRGLSMRYILVISIALSVVGAVLKIGNLLSPTTASWLQTGAVAVTFGGMALIVALIIGLFVMAIRHEHGKPIPGWLEALVTKAD